ncbi:hypothetical protein GF312_18820 [Candidatus Poribacteria bacterium]|nr:hypothetical protein [Candidatus Poribacteria bacterium]
MQKPRIWAHMTVQEIREYLKERPTAILPIGCTEQHGYHLPTNVDILNAEEMAKRVSAETGIAVLPTVNYTYSGGELPGTVNVSPNIIALYLEEICLSLAAQKVKNIILLLGHGGSENNQAIMAFRDLFLRKHRHLEVVLAVIPLFAMGDDGVLHMLCDNETRKLYKPNDWHAGKTETSLMLYWEPDLVHMDRLTQDSKGMAELMRIDPDAYQDIQKPVDSPYVAPRAMQRKEIQVGVMGYPEEATAEIGERMAQSGVKELLKIIKNIERR